MIARRARVGALLATTMLASATPALAAPGPLACGTLVVPNGVGVSSSADIASFNPARAFDLLKQAGCRPGPDGIMQKNGVKRAFIQSMLSGDATIDPKTDIVAGDRRAVGIDIKGRDIAFSPVLNLPTACTRSGRPAALAMMRLALPVGDQFAGEADQICPDQLNCTAPEGPAA